MSQGIQIIKTVLRVAVIAIVVFLFNSCKSTLKKGELHDINFTNPILYIDYSDPDVVKAGNKYYMTASSFNCTPALPLLESDNMVDWKLIGYAIDNLEPDAFFDRPQHGNGVWAPAIRYHNNEFYIFYGDPDFGIYMVKAKDIHGPWSKPHLVKAGKGWIDPCPFWDDNGDAWLVHAWAGSRAGIKSTLTLHKMSFDGKALLDNGIIVFDGHVGNRTVEGPKMYKRNGYYYILAPAGGVTEGWQLALRSKNVTGPYEMKKVLEQGTTKINGPHQGAWVEGQDGSSWFYHFQDNGAFGRIVHMQPVEWIDNWPVMGNDTDDDGCGEPVLEGVVQSLNPKAEINPNEYSDEFNTPDISLHWQWHANTSPKYGAPTAHLGFMRLNAAPFTEVTSLWDVPNLLLQKFPAQSFNATTKLDLFMHEEHERTGLLIMGYDYAWIGIERKNNQNHLVYKVCLKANIGGTEETLFSEPWNNETIYLKASVNEQAKTVFEYSTDGKSFEKMNTTFASIQGKWIGAKIGLFCISSTATNNAGYVNADWFRIQIP